MSKVGPAVALVGASTSNPLLLGAGAMMTQYGSGVANTGRNIEKARKQVKQISHFS